MKTYLPQQTSEHCYRLLYKLMKSQVKTTGSCALEVMRMLQNTAGRAGDRGGSAHLQRSPGVATTMVRGNLSIGMIDAALASGWLGGFLNKSTAVFAFTYSNLYFPMFPFWQTRDGSE